MFINNYFLNESVQLRNKYFTQYFCYDCFNVKYTFLLSELEKDFDSLSKVNTTKLILDTAHQKEDLIHRFDNYNIALKILKMFPMMC